MGALQAVLIRKIITVIVWCHWDVCAMAAMSEDSLSLTSLRTDCFVCGTSVDLSLISWQTYALRRA